MSEPSSRLWWPFPMQPIEKQSEETKAKIAFLEEATSQGLRAFIDESDCGAIAGDGRECYLIWRGKQHCELLLIDSGSVSTKKMYVDPVPASALRQASADALEWMLHQDDQYRHRRVIEVQR